MADFVSFDLNFPYPLIDVTSDRSGPRPAVKPPTASQLVGIDGSLRGGLRPFPGFMRAVNLDFYERIHHDEGSFVNFFEVVNINIGESGYGVAVVYRAKRSPLLANPERADVFVEIWNSNTDGVDEFGIRGMKVVHNVPATALMSVEVFGQFVYVAIEGRSPAMFYVKEVLPEPVESSSSSSSSSSTSSTSSTTTSSGAEESSSECEDAPPSGATYEVVKFGFECDNELPGPGRQPRLRSPEKMPEVEIGDFAPTSATFNDDDNRPGEGAIVITEVPPAEFDWFSADDSSSGGAPAFEEGRRLQDGGYNFMYYLLDSRTGRRSAPSEVAQVRTEDFNDHEKIFGSVDDGGVATSTTSSSGAIDPEANDFYVALEVVYDSDKFDQMVVYRSLRTLDAGGTQISAYLQAEKIIDLKTYWTKRDEAGEEFDPAVTELKHAVYYYQFEDKQLTVQPSFLGAIYADEEMPKGGAMIWYDGALLISSIGSRGKSTKDGNRFGDALRGLGEIRFSSLMDVSPELFAPSDRYVPKTPNNAVISFQEVGGNVLGFSKDRVYHVHKRNVFIDVHEMHEGYGIVNPFAADSVGSLVIYATPTGLAQIDTTGELDEVRGVDKVFQEDWAQTLGLVSIAFDPEAKCLFVHNAALEHTICLWLRTAKMTEVFDGPFTLVRRGAWFSDRTDFSSPVTSRALFLQNIKWNDGEAEEAEEVPAVLGCQSPTLWLLDFNREKIILGAGDVLDGSPRRSLLEFDGDSRFTTKEDVSDSVVYMGDAGSNIGEDLHGCYLYVLDSSDASFIGKKAKIRGRKDDSSIEVDEVGAEALKGLPGGSRVGISPVYFRWVGHPMPAAGPQAMSPVHDSFTVKMAKTLYASFTDVDFSRKPDEGSSSEQLDVAEDARYRALAYEGSDAEPLDMVIPVETNGQKRESVVDGPSDIGGAFGASSGLLGKNGVRAAVLSPGLEVFVPDLDFRLLGVLVEGKIEGTSTLSLPFANPTN